MLTITQWFNIVYVASLVTCAYALVRTKYGDEFIDNITRRVTSW